MALHLVAGRLEQADRLAAWDTWSPGHLVGGGWSARSLEQADFLSHPVLEGKPNANHVHARISYSRTQQLHNMDIITRCSNSINKGNSRLHHTSETSI
jgi:hypothetical protein